MTLPLILYCVPPFVSIQDQQDAASKVILHVATVGQGTAILIECQDTKNEGAIIAQVYFKTWYHLKFMSYLQLSFCT